MDALPPVGRVGCPNCGRSYSYKKHLLRHLRNGCDEFTTIYQQNKTCQQLPVLRCAKCNFATFLKDAMAKHLQEIHPLIS